MELKETAELHVVVVPNVGQNVPFLLSAHI